MGEGCTWKCVVGDKRKNESEFHVSRLVNSAKRVCYNFKHEGELQKVLCRRISQEFKNPSDFTGEDEL